MTINETVGADLKRIAKLVYGAQSVPNKTQAHKSTLTVRTVEWSRGGTNSTTATASKSGKPTNRRWGDHNSDWKKPELEVAAAPSSTGQSYDGTIA